MDSPNLFSAACGPGWPFRKPVCALCLLLRRMRICKKLKFPSELLVISTVVSSFVVQGVGFVLFLIGLMVWKGTLLGVAGFFLIIPIGLHVIFAIGIGMLLACGNVFFRDVGQLTGAAFTMWFFLTPILYPASLVPEAVRTVQLLNPMIPIINAYRSIILTGIFAPGITLVYSLGWRPCSCGSGTMSFNAAGDFSRIIYRKE